MGSGLGLTAVFDGSFDGFFSVIHSHYYDKRRFSEVVSERDFEPSLAEYIFISADSEKAVKVMEAIRKISLFTDELVYKAFLSKEEKKFTYIYKYLIKAFKTGAKINEALADPDVANVFALHRNVNKEVERFIQFCRFSQMENGVFYSKIEPKSNVLPLVAGHFSNRFQNQPWLIHDETYKQAAIYDTNEYVIVDVTGRQFHGFEADNKEYSDLWKVFFNAVAVEGRINYRLQRGLVPLWYRKNMLEFEENSQKEAQKSISEKNDNLL